MNNYETLLSQYIKEINKFPRLSANELIYLLKRKEYNRSARNKIIQSYLFLVVNIAKKYYYNRPLLFDIIQEGNIGLSLGIDKYDYRKQYSFENYIIPWIRQYIIRFFEKNNRLIRLPARKIHTARKLNNVLNSHENKNLKISNSTRKAVIYDKLCRTLFIYDNQSFDKYFATIFYEEKLLRIYREVINDLLKTLILRDRQIIEYHYGLLDGEYKSLCATGKKFNLSPEGIRFIEKMAFKSLKKEFTNHYSNIL